MSDKIISAEKAVRLIKDEDFVAIQGSGGGVGEPTLILNRLGAKFRKEGSPRSLTLCHATGLGDKNEIGTDYLALKGLVKRDIAGHLGMAPKMAKMILDNEIEAYNFPQGVISHMYAAVAGKKPGVITKVGLCTYVDPRLEGGKMNSITKEDLVKIIQIDNQEWLFFPLFHIDVALVRGTTADTKGNITFEEEGAFLEGISIAQAAKNCGGIVIAQVKYLAKEGTLSAQSVKIPGIYVDFIVVDANQKQTCLDFYNPAFSGQVKIPLDRIQPIPLDIKKVIAKRAYGEIFNGAIVNLGVGIPSGIAAVAIEEGGVDDFTLTIEQGSIGGIPAGGVIFGVSYNPTAIIEEDAQFSFYDGGGLDLGFLGMAEADREGNVNSSKVGNMLSGCGGFINISQNTKKVVFCGTFTAKGLECRVAEGQLKILSEGAKKKFVKHVKQVTFSGKYSQSNNQQVLYITERAVFSLEQNGVKLIEIAPGIDLEKDIISQMDFHPIIPGDIKLMDHEIFK